MRSRDALDDHQFASEVLRLATTAAHRYARPERVDDVAQHVAIRAFSARDSFRGDSSLATWIDIIARRETYRDWEDQNRQVGRPPRSLARSVDLDVDKMADVDALGYLRLDPADAASAAADAPTPLAVQKYRSVVFELAHEALGAVDNAGMVNVREDRAALSALVHSCVEPLLDVVFDDGGPAGFAIQTYGRQLVSDAFSITSTEKRAHIERLRVRPVSTLAALGLAQRLIEDGHCLPAVEGSTLGAHIDAIELRIDDDVTQLLRQRALGNPAGPLAERLRRSRSYLNALRPESPVLGRLNDPVDAALELPPMLSRAVACR